MGGPSEQQHAPTVTSPKGELSWPPSPIRTIPEKSGPFFTFLKVLPWIQRTSLALETVCRGRCLGLSGLLSMSPNRVHFMDRSARKHPGPIMLLLADREPWQSNRSGPAHCKKVLQLQRNRKMLVYGSLTNRSKNEGKKQTIVKCVPWFHPHVHAVCFLFFIFFVSGGFCWFHQSPSLLGVVIELSNNNIPSSKFPFSIPLAVTCLKLLLLLLNDEKIK